MPLFIPKGGPVCGPHCSVTAPNWAAIVLVSIAGLIILLVTFRTNWRTKQAWETILLSIAGGMMVVIIVLGLAGSFSFTHTTTDGKIKHRFDECNVLYRSLPQTADSWNGCVALARDPNN
jgi:hypothetical protein